MPNTAQILISHVQAPCINPPLHFFMQGGLIIFASCNKCSRANTTFTFTVDKLYMLTFRILHKKLKLNFDKMQLILVESYYTITGTDHK